MDQTRRLDILCPGDWRDSYESRVCNRTKDGYGYEIRSLDDLIHRVQDFAMQEDFRYDGWLFPKYELYVDGRCFGSLTKNFIEIDLVEYEYMEIDGKPAYVMHYLGEPGVESIRIPLGCHTATLHRVMPSLFNKNYSKL